MMKKPPGPIVAIEEHYWDDELATHFSGPEASKTGIIEKRLRDLGGERLGDMDAAGVDLCVLSHGAPSGQKIPADIAIPLVRRVNDRLAAAVAANPKRFAAFAALPTAAPEAAADELERCVGLGFKGAMVHGMTNGEFLDLPKYWPIYARAEKLDVPVYFHPAYPHPAVVDAYYRDYLQDYPMLARPAWGYTVDAGTQGVRLVLSGVFEKHPRLKVIFGHLGESIPFQLWRLDAAFNRPGQGKRIAFRDIVTNNFWITTSGFFSTPALLCCAMEMGVDRILFAVDWPFVADSTPGVEWMSQVPLSAEDKAKILGGNARRLLKL
jgi:predicted TIM-barrel fold metal-dependent hydrolase